MTCETCGGNGIIDVKCRRCGGSGMAYGEICCGGWDEADCPECGGTGEVDDD